jgi:hypothetical protein
MLVIRVEIYRDLILANLLKGLARPALLVILVAAAKISVVEVDTHTSIHLA